jgi:hypothetical protein
MHGLTNLKFICFVENKRQDNKLENCCIWLVIYF